MVYGKTEEDAKKRVLVLAEEVIRDRLAFQE